MASSSWFRDAGSRGRLDRASSHDADGEPRSDFLARRCGPRDLLLLGRATCPPPPPASWRPPCEQDQSGRSDVTLGERERGEGAA
jgi:hypothetical protein